MEYHILNDQELSFQDIMKRHLSGEGMLDVKEKKLYEEMRSNVAAARKEVVKEEKEETKEANKEKQDEEEKDDIKDVAKDEVKALPKEENEEAKTKTEDEAKENEVDKKDEDISEAVEDMETDQKELPKEEIEPSKSDNEHKESSNIEEKEEEDDEEKLTKTKLKIKLKKGKKRGPGRPPKNLEKDNPFVEDDLDDIESMGLDDLDDDGVPILPKTSLEKPAKKKPGRPPGRPKKQVDTTDDLDGKRSTRSEMKVIPFDGSPSKGSVSLTPVKKSCDQDQTQRRKGGYVNVSIDPPQISLQQMEQMARGGVYDMDMMTDLMQQTYAAAIKWPKDRILTIRLEHIMEAVETDNWPVSKDFSYAEAAQLTIPESPVAEEGVAVATPVPTPARSEVSEVSNPYEDTNILTPGRKHGNRGRKPLGTAGSSLHSPESLDKSSKIRSLLTAGHQGRHNQVENEEIR